MIQALSKLLLCSHVESRSHWLVSTALELWVSRTVRPWIELCQSDLRVDLISTLGQVISWSFRTFHCNQNDLIDASDFENLVSDWVYEAYNMNELFLQRRVHGKFLWGNKRGWCSRYTTGRETRCAVSPWMVEVYAYCPDSMLPL